MFDARQKCNVKGPHNYFCTKDVVVRNGQRIPHEGKHTACTFVGNVLGSEVVSWEDKKLPEWNQDYRGR